MYISVKAFENADRDSAVKANVNLTIDNAFVVKNLTIVQGRNGMFRAYMVMKGSSELDTEEFSRLLDGVIDECKQMGVDYRKPWER